jgi:hypothetical protein
VLGAEIADVGAEPAGGFQMAFRRTDDGPAEGGRRIHDHRNAGSLFEVPHLQ